MRTALQSAGVIDPAARSAIEAHRSRLRVMFVEEVCRHIQAPSLDPELAAFIEQKSLLATGHYGFD